jgi:CheY-like chemotaxis protein
MPTVLICSDAQWVHDEIRAAAPGGDTVIRSLTAGRAVREVVATDQPDLVILDMQISDMCCCCLIATPIPTWRKSATLMAG